MTLRRKPRPAAQASPELAHAFAALLPPTVRPVGTFRMATAADMQCRVMPRSKAPEPLQSKPRPRTHTRDESAHLGRVKALRCVLCARLGLSQDSQTDAHHTREDQGGAQRASDWLAIALCHEGCHQGPHGIHGDKARLRHAKCTELDLLADTLQALFTNQQKGVI
jgi:hypothetical protein